MEEEWKPIKDFPDYQVSNLGRVKSLFGRYGILERILKPHPVGSKGEQYLAVALYNEEKKLHIKIHKLVAEYFLTNPDNLPCIDHINRNKIDNRAENLRWASYQTNAINQTRKVGRLNQKYIYETKSNNYLVNIRRYKKAIVSKVFNSLEEAVEARDTFLISN
jgi:hypothetical protein